MVGGNAGIWLAILLALLAAVGVTILGAIRAARSRDIGWVVAIVAAGAFSMGWVVAIIYLAAVDAFRDRQAHLDPSGEGPEGWYADPVARHEQRYWDGARWTEHVTDRGRPSADPV